MTEQQRKAMEMALKFIVVSSAKDKAWYTTEEFELVSALRQALAQPVDAVNMTQERVDETAKDRQEPVAWMWKNIDGHQVLTDDPDYADGTWTPLYTAPPKREWVGLTDDELNHTPVRWTMINGPGDYLLPFARAVEAKLKEKNT